jgi:hypothetical protein
MLAATQELVLVVSSSTIDNDAPILKWSFHILYGRIIEPRAARYARKPHELEQHLLMHQEANLPLLSQGGNETQRNRILETIAVPLSQVLDVLVDVDGTVNVDFELAASPVDLCGSGTSRSRVSTDAFRTFVSRKTDGALCITAISTPGPNEAVELLVCGGPYCPS